LIDVSYLQLFFLFIVKVMLFFISNKERERGIEQLEVMAFRSLAIQRWSQGNCRQINEMEMCEFEREHDDK
jgi:hypothetical protein